MHSANYDKSARLQRVAKALKQAGSKGLTTKSIIREANVCAVNSIISELRENGFDIRCVCEGRGKYRYFINAD